ncbi:hypothetical protein Fot_29165 [Forsythia ovata]|uniref:Uncharacterized protein n=1 Tax=Forsythia ovata TaxID=205694 RepID=A0ABD1TR55_9LAMI
MTLLHVTHQINARVGLSRAYQGGAPDVNDDGPSYFLNIKSYQSTTHQPSTDPTSNHEGHPETPHFKPCCYSKDSIVSCINMIQNIHEKSVADHFIMKFQHVNILPNFGKSVIDDLEAISDRAKMLHGSQIVTHPLNDSPTNPTPKMSA